MNKKNPNIFSHPSLQFYIEKPADWVFIPQAWTDNFREQKYETNPDLKEKLKKAVKPFVHFYKPHEEPDFPLPTVQCGCRINGLPSNTSLEEVMQKMIQETLFRVFPDVEVIEANPNFILSGYQSIYIRIKFSMKNLDNQPIWCLGRTIMTITPTLIYNLGLTGSLDEKYRCEDTFREVMYSIKLGQKYLRHKRS